MLPKKQADSAPCWLQVGWGGRAGGSFKGTGHHPRVISGLACTCQEEPDSTLVKVSSSAPSWDSLRTGPCRPQQKSLSPLCVLESGGRGLIGDILEAHWKREGARPEKWLYALSESQAGKIGLDLTALWRVVGWGEKGAQISCSRNGPRAVQHASSIQTEKLLSFLLRKMDFSWGKTWCVPVTLPAPGSAGPNEEGHRPIELVPGGPQGNDAKHSMLERDHLKSSWAFPSTLGDCRGRERHW